MYREKTRKYGAAMVLISVCLRLCMLLGLDSKAAVFLSQTAAQREFGRWMLFLETGQAVTVPEEPEEELFVLEILPPETEEEETEEEPAPEPVSLPLAPAESLSVAGACTYTFDKAALLNRPSTMDFSGEGPHILIVHTHGSEAYTPDGTVYTATTAFRTLDTAHSVIRVGDVLAEALESAGLSVIHDRSINDHPSYNSSYWTTLGKIENWKQQYPNLQLIIDVHRDAVEDSDGRPLALSATVGQTSCARLMLVVGTDQGGLTHPDWQENLANALKLQSVLEGAYPGLCRSIDLRTERFNQHTSPGALLVEVGTNGNTLQEAEAAAKLLGQGIAATISALEQNNGTLTQ